MSKRKPHNHLAGYVCERKHPKGHIIIFVAKDAGIDVEHKYVVCIETTDFQFHVGPDFPALPKARAFMKDELDGCAGYDWNFEDADAA